MWALHAAIVHTSEGESAPTVNSMTAVGLLLPKNPIVGFTGGIAKEKLIHLLVVSANSRDSVERIRQTPSDESASRKFADMIGLMIGS